MTAKESEILRAPFSDVADKLAAAFRELFLTATDPEVTRGSEDLNRAESELSYALEEGMAAICWLISTAPEPQPAGLRNFRVTYRDLSIAEDGQKVEKECAVIVEAGSIELAEDWFKRNFKDKSTMTRCFRLSTIAEREEEPKKA